MKKVNMLVVRREASFQQHHHAEFPTAGASLSALHQTPSRIPTRIGKTKVFGDAVSGKDDLVKGLSTSGQKMYILILSAY